MIMCIQEVVNGNRCFMFDAVIVRAVCALQCAFDKHGSSMFPHIRKEMLELVTNSG